MLFRFEPALFNEMFSLTEPVEGTFPDLLTPFAFLDRTSVYPYINVAEYKDEVQVVAELPGISKDDVKLQIHNGELTISGERKAPENAKESEWIRQEVRYGSFSRTIPLPKSVDGEKVSAEYTNGMLLITLPKQEAAKPKEIVIR
jgi:HSP20 family protein